MAESYAGLDSISVIKQFSSAPLRQTEFFKLNKKHSAELGWSSCCVNTFVVSASAKFAIGPSSRRSMRHAAFSIKQNGQDDSSRRAEILVAKELAADLYELEQKQEASESGGAVMHKVSDDLSMDELEASEIVSGLHTARCSRFRRLLWRPFAVCWPILKHFDHGHNEQHVEGDADPDHVGLDPS